MTAPEATTAPTWSYRFTQPGEVEIETRDLDGDESARVVARELSRAGATPVTIHRLQKAANSWEYIAEVDERPDTT